MLTVHFASAICYLAQQHITVALHGFPAAGRAVIPLMTEVGLHSLTVDRRPVVTHHIAAEAWGFRCRLAWSWLPTMHHHHYGNPLKDCQHHFCSLAHCKGGILFPSHSCFGRLSISIIKQRLYELELCIAHRWCACIWQRSGHEAVWTVDSSSIHSGLNAAVNSL